jgi:hypothetical protein
VEDTWSLLSANHVKSEAEDGSKLNLNNKIIFSNPELKPATLIPRNKFFIIHYIAEEKPEIMP